MEIRNLFIQWDTSNRCNLRCSHCYHTRNTNEQEDNEMKLEEVKSMIDNLYETSKRWNFKPRFNASGGEPLLRKDLYEILEYTQSRGIETRLLTNGTLIDRAVAENLKERGIKNLQISLDGNKETHNLIRGFDWAYDAALEGIVSCKEKGIKVTVSMTLMQSNKSQFKDVVLAAEKSGAKYVAFQSYVPSGKADPEFVGPEDTYEMFKEARRLDREHEITVLQTEVLWHLMRTDSKMKRFARKEKENYAGGCSAGFTGVAVLADGVVYPCRRMPIPIGHISEGLVALITEKDLMKKLRNFNNIESDCEHKPYCRGCRAVTLARTGNLFAEDPMCFKKFVQPEDLTDKREGLIKDNAKIKI